MFSPSMLKRPLQKLGLDITRFPGDHGMGHLVTLLRTMKIDTVVDVGANDGGYGRLLRAYGYSEGIVSYEPLLEPFMRLQEAIRNDSLWQAYNYALGPGSGDVVMNVAANNGASSSILPMLSEHEGAAPEAKVVGVEIVTQRSLDSMWNDSLAQSRRILVKMDVQGYERQVLSGAVEALASKNFLGLQLEISFVHLYDGSWLFPEVMAFAERWDLELVRVIPGFTDSRTGRMLQADGVFVKRNIL